MTNALISADKNGGGNDETHDAVDAAYDERLNQPSRPIGHSVSPEEFEAATHGEIGLRYEIPLGQPIRKVRVIVYDAELGAVGSVTIPIQH